MGGGYGESEDVLGHFSSKLKDCNVVSKIPSLKNNNHNIEKVFYRTLERMKRNNLYALMFHDPSDLTGKDGKKYYEEILAIKKTNLVKPLVIETAAHRKKRRSHIESPTDYARRLATAAHDAGSLAADCDDGRLTAAAARAYGRCRD